MWVESQAGQGATFFFSLIAPAHASLRENDLCHEQPILRGRSVLFLDRYASNCRSFFNVVSPWGVQVTSFSAIDDLSTHLETGVSFDVIFCDASFTPEELLTLGHLFQTRFFGTPVVLCNSIARTVLSQQLLDQFGAPRFLAKPFKQHQIYNVMLNTMGADLNHQIARKSLTSHAFSTQAASLPTHLRLLLVEDNVINQKVAISMLDRLGYHTDVAGNGFEAIAALQRQPYDVVFMDVQMPEMDGYETTKRIKRDLAPQLGASFPTIVAMTANAMVGDRELCLAAGMDDYISKPIHPEEIIRVLTQWCGDKVGVEVDEKVEVEVDEKVDVESEVEVEHERLELSQESPTASSLDRAIDDEPQPDTHAHDQTHDQTQPHAYDQTHDQTQPHTATPSIAITRQSTEAINETAILALRELIGYDDIATFNEIVQAYIMQSPQLIAAMRAAVALRDLEELGMAAHTLRSTSETLGALDLSDGCFRLEMQIQAGEPWAKITASLEQLEASYIKARQALEQLQSASTLV